LQGAPAYPAQVHIALGGAAAWPLPAWAQQPAQVRRIGVLMPVLSELGRGVRARTAAVGLD